MVTGDLSPQAGLLGSLLIDDRLVPQALARVREEDFLSPVYRDVFRAIRRCYTEGTPVDPVTVLTAMGGGEELRGLLMQLMELTPTAAHWEAYARDARREARKARARDLAGQILESPGLEEIQGLIGHLQAYDDALTAGDEDRVRALLREGREIKTALDREEAE